mmetsp:Transcript_43097/g.111691  ORF Transcript_43097/g.111691 Transcript_43097/m.111691 type:complete len:344 (+) Transcript_43097:1935-2966(+)
MTCMNSSRLSIFLLKAAARMSIDCTMCTMFPVMYANTVQPIDISKMRRTSSTSVSGVISPYPSVVIVVTTQYSPVRYCTHIVLSTISCVPFSVVSEVSVIHVFSYSSTFVPSCPFLDATKMRRHVEKWTRMMTKKRKRSMRTVPGLIRIIDLILPKYRTSLASLTSLINFSSFNNLNTRGRRSILLSPPGMSTPVSTRKTSIGTDPIKSVKNHVVRYARATAFAFHSIWPSDICAAVRKLSTMSAMKKKSMQVSTTITPMPGSSRVASRMGTTTTLYMSSTTTMESQTMRGFRRGCSMHLCFISAPSSRYSLSLHSLPKIGGRGSLFLLFTPPLDPSLGRAAL